MPLTAAVITNKLTQMLLISSDPFIKTALCSKSPSESFSKSAPRGCACSKKVCNIKPSRNSLLEPTLAIRSTKSFHSLKIPSNDLCHKIT